MAGAQSSWPLTHVFLEASVPFAAITDPVFLSVQLISGLSLCSGPLPPTSKPAPHLAVLQVPSPSGMREEAPEGSWS